MSVRNSIRDAIRSAIGLVEEVFNPQTLFLSGEQGVWYDPSDLSTLFQDSAGTTPVTGMEQPVGLMLDKSKGLVRGPDVAAPVPGATWTRSGGSFTSVTTSYGSYLALGGVAGVTYEVKMFVSGGVTTQVKPSGPAVALAQGWNTLIFMADTVAPRVQALIGAVVSEVSLRELPGNHAAQPTAASRPILTARKNLLLNTHLTGGASGTVGVDAIAPTGWTFSAANGGTLAIGEGTVTISASGSSQKPAICSASLVASANTNMAFSTKLKSTTAPIQLDNIMGIAAAPVGSVITYAVDGLERPGATLVSSGSVVEVRLAVGATAGYPALRLGVNVFSGHLSTGTVEFSSPQVEVSGGRTRYQRVNTSTDYDYAGFPIGLRCDGVDDGMVTGNIDFTGTDKMLSVIGWRKLSDATQQWVYNHNNVAAGSFRLQPSANAASASITSVAVGSASLTSASTNLPAPASFVATSIHDLAAAGTSLKVNGVSPAPGSGAGGGAFASAPLYLFSRSNLTSYCGGFFFGAIIAAAAYSASQIASAERYLAGKSGVTV